MIYISPYRTSPSSSMLEQTAIVPFGYSSIIIVFLALCLAVDVCMNYGMTLGVIVPTFGMSQPFIKALGSSKSAGVGTLLKSV